MTSSMDAPTTPLYYFFASTDCLTKTQQSHPCHIQMHFQNPMDIWFLVFFFRLSCMSTLERIEKKSDAVLRMPNPNDKMEANSIWSFLYLKFFCSVFWCQSLDVSTSLFGILSVEQTTEQFYLEFVHKSNRLQGVYFIIVLWADFL